MTPDRRRAAAPLPALMLASGVLAALGVALVARTDLSRAVSLGAFVSGGTAVATGLVVGAASRHRVAAARPSLRLLALAIGVWGLGQLAVGAAAADGVAAFPTFGDALSTASGPIAIAGLLTAPRARLGRIPSVRLALDSMLLGSCAALLEWRVSFREVLFVAGASPSDLAAVPILLLEIVILVLLLLAWLRDLDGGLLLLLGGFALYTGADHVTMHTVVRGEQWPWQGAVLWCIAWPVIGWGLLRFDPLRVPQGERERLGSEARVTMATTVVSLSILGAFLAAVTRDSTVDPVSLAFAVLVVLAFGAREVYGGVQRHRTVATLTAHAFADPLTGLGNRRAMTETLRTLARSSSGSVLTLDLDGFKDVNDVLGHARGDALLVAVSARLRSAMPAGAGVFRIGGDEFAGVVPGDRTRALQAADAMLAAVRAAADDVPGARAVVVSASVGLARVEQGAVARDEDVLAVLAESGVALRSAKQSGRDRVESYDGPVAASHRRCQAVERRLRLALEAGRLQVHYQPVMHLASRRVVGVEALARWDDPVLGRVTPDEFIPVAERSGLIAELGDLVLRRALTDILGSPGLPGSLRIAVNVSAVQLRSAAFADEVLGVVSASGVDPERLVMEVTESVFVDEGDGGLRHLVRLRDAGLQVAIDDFGSGYSSLAYLGRLPATVLKVDRSLTASVLGDPRSLAVLTAVVELGRTLPIEIVVEGIEEEAEHDLVLGLGAGLAQGRLYAAAVPASQLPGVVASLHAGPVPSQAGTPGGGGS